ncbi:MAG: glycosyltransferase [Gammaproteobacteria bacterium]
MKILMISDVYFPRVNGVSTSIATFRKAFIELGHQVTLIGLMKAGAVRDLLPQLRKQEFDLIHIQTPFRAHYLGLWLARRLGIPKVETYHTFFEEYLFHYLPFVPKRMMRFLARRFSARQCNQVDGVVVPSRAMLEVLRDYGVTTREVILPTGIELEAFAQGDGQAMRKRLEIDPDQPVLVHVGRIAFEKNIDFLLKTLTRVVAQVPELAVIIAGEGPALKHIKQMTQELELDDVVHFVGYMKREQLPDCYRAGDAFIFASRTETQGLVLLEAMACGTPVVSTAVLGTHDILDAGKGALVAEEDLNDFAMKCVRILSDRNLRQRLAQEALEWAQEWSDEALAKQMLGFYEDVQIEYAAAAREPA